MSRRSQLALASVLVLSGCSSTPLADKAVEQARSEFQAVRDDTRVLHSAPRDVIRAGESLGRAERLSSYWGSRDDVLQYAYLSQRYSEIARERANLDLNQERLAKQQLERERLQLSLREAKLASVQEQSKWLEAQMVSLATNQTERGLVLTLGDVLFDSGEADLKPAANRTVLKLVQFLQLNPRRVIRIEGYTDNQGDEQQNQELSRARAQSVADVLSDLGVDAKRVQVQGFGEAYPVADNASSLGRAQNRRVEIVFSDDKGTLGASR